MADFSDAMLDSATPLSVVVDVLADVTTRLSGHYVHRSRTASSPEEKKYLVDKSFEVKSRKKATDFRDREAVVARIREFKAELAESKVTPSPRRNPYPH